MLDGSFRLIGPGLALILLATASACGNGGDKPRTLPPVSQTPVSSSITPTPTAPTATSLESAVRSYYEAIERAAAGGATTELKSLALSSCPCNALPAFIEKTYRQHNTIHGWSYKIRRVYEVHVAGRAGSALVVYDLPLIRTVSPTGKTIGSEQPIANRTVSVSAAWTDDGWRVSNIAVLGR